MKKCKNRIIKMMIIILSVITLTLTSVCVYAYIYEKKSDEYAKKYEAQYEKSKDTVDLLNICYYLSETQNNSNLEEYYKKAIDAVTLEDIKQSKFSELFNQSPYKSPKVFMISMYITFLILEEKYDLYIQEYASYYTEAYSNLEGDELIELQSIAMPLFISLKDSKIIESEIKAYEQIIDSTDNTKLQETCKIHIDLLTDFLEEAKQKEA